MVLPGDGIVREMVYPGRWYTQGVVLLVGGTPMGRYCKGNGILGGSTTSGWYSQGMVL